MTPAFKQQEGVSVCCENKASLFLFGCLTTVLDVFVRYFNAQALSEECVSEVEDTAVLKAEFPHYNKGRANLSMIGNLISVGVTYV